MSVEADTMHYYAQLDRDNARDAAIERRVVDEADEMEAAVYDWLTVRFGENCAIALTDPQGYPDADVLKTVREARLIFFEWRETEAKRAAINYVDGG